MRGEQTDDGVECDGCAGREFESLDRRTVLSRLGDILCARTARAPLIICLVTEITGDLLVTRRVTSRDMIKFDRVTGLEKDDPVPAEIVSVEPLPADIHDIMLRIDRRTRLQVDRSHFKLDEEEKRALCMLDEHYYTHLI